MGRRTSYAPGTFCAVDLATSDPAGAAEFYGPLFGWESREVQLGYTTLVLRGDAVAGLFPRPEQQRSAGVPPHWFSYVAVASADDTAARARDLGGEVHAGPHDVSDAGRMAVITDPTGAFFDAWQAKDFAGAARVNDPGCLTMNELATSDTERAAAFYSGLFGWRITELDTGGGLRYWSIGHDGAARGLNGGMREAGPAPSSWTPYFTVESTDDACAQAERSGGGVLTGPMDIPSGRIAALRDPQGAVFAIFEGEVDN
ncbi:MAG: VOC family protein [Propionibacteriales bacterium]|nr:VOC family protein [Propionibacteriales bacterium]